MAKPNPQVAAHLEWLGFVKPMGLVVSPTALVRAGAILDRRDAEGQDRLRACIDGHDSDDLCSSPSLPSFRDFAGAVLGWSFSPKGYAGTKDSPVPSELETTMLDSSEIVRPRYAVRMGKDESEWQLLVLVGRPGGDFEHAEGKQPSPHAAMERLLRNAGVPAGLLFNGKCLRLVSAPMGESSGWLDFRVADMAETAGRPICTAMRLLLHETRLLAAPRDKRLAALMDDSRKFQNEVSQELSEQVLHALYELLRGFQAAHDASPGKRLLARFLDPGHPRDDQGDPNEVYRGLLTLVLRLIFVLYAEERDLLPQDRVFLDAYSVAGLHKRLREDAALHPDTMDQRYGAYAQLLFLFRMIHDGARSDIMILPPRRGALFDPDRYRFLEGRSAQVAGGRQAVEAVEPPRVSDGVVYRVLEKLLVLKGERISYRALDVEHIGSVYETMMGFRLETATGRSVAIKAAKPHGAPATVDLDELLAESPGRRAKWIRDRTDRVITDKVSKAVRQADTIEALHAALASVVDADATPDLVAPGSMVLQPSEERRRSGSHYTPRKLTEPIVRDTLKPVLDRLRDNMSAAPPPPPDTPHPPDAAPPPPRKNSRPQGVRPSHGFRRLFGGSVPPAWRCLSRILAFPQHPTERSDGRGPSRFGASRSCPTVPLRRGPQPGRGGLGQAVAVAGDAGQGPSLDLPRSCVAPRRFAGGVDQQADCLVSLEGGRARVPIGVRGHEGTRATPRSQGVAPPDSRGGRGCLRFGAVRHAGQSRVGDGHSPANR